MFSVEDREALRDRLVGAALADPRIGAAALTGSAAVGREDRWSDIDLALAVVAEPDAVVEEWTARMYAEAGAVDHTDVYRMGTLFRVFLLASTLQVDIAFWPEAEFGPTASTFRLLFGPVGTPSPLPTMTAVERVGWGWLYALHVRTSLARGRVWQAEYLLSLLRAEVHALACLRLGLAADQGRGTDDLPLTATVPDGLVRSLDPPELHRAFAVLTSALLAETAAVDADRAARLRDPLHALTQPLP